MGITNFADYGVQNKPLYRVYKSVNKKVTQEYFSELGKAQQRLAQIESNLPKKGSLDDFLFDRKVPASFDYNGTPGCRFVSFKLETSSGKKKSVAPCFSVFSNNDKVKHFKNFYLSSLGVDKAFKGAVQEAMAVYQTLYPSALSEKDQKSIIRWTNTKKTIERVTNAVWKRFNKADIKRVILSTEAIKQGNPMFLSLVVQPNGKPKLSIQIGTSSTNLTTRFARGITISSFNQLLMWTGYFSSYVMKHYQFSSQDARRHYAGAVYFKLITSWKTQLSQVGIEVPETLPWTRFEEALTQFSE